MGDWADRTHVHFTKAGDALIAVEDCTDVKCMRAACTTAHDALNIDLKADLPSPDPKLTDALNSMLDDFDKGMHLCMNLPANPTKAHIAQMESYMDKSMVHLEDAKSILDDYLAAAP